MSNPVTPSNQAGSEIRALNHAIARMRGGGLVLLLNTGAIITPEDTAMLQALHSRSSKGVLEHLEKLARVGSGRFMKEAYIGYGHKSIGDCGTITLFIEGVSMLAAKAIQDWLLYSGQECSTRYLDFAKQFFLNPSGSRKSRGALNSLRKYYVTSMDGVKESLRKRFPRKKYERRKKYEKAIAARAFDILRGFLPAGAVTNLTWHGNLRQTADKLMYLRHHPLEEVRRVAKAMEKVCRKANPNSFKFKRYPLTEEFIGNYMSNDYYFDEVVPKFKVVHDGIDRNMLARYSHLLVNRPPKTEFPKQLGQTGTLRVQWLLDFGSFRDIQRQRSLIQRMPLLTTKLGFHQWYLNELPEDIQERGLSLLKKIESVCADIDPLVAQYAIPMGYLTANEFSGDIPALTYVAELRATVFVHPTLQEQAFKLASILEKKFGKFGYKTYVDPSTYGRFDVRRGKQDIVIKK